MINQEHKELLDYLESEKVIDQKYVLWWQKGFEGRRVYSKEEFNSNLQTVSYEAESLNGRDVAKTPHKIEHGVWIKDDVPITFQDYVFKGRKVPCFISVKPMSHDRNEGWKELESFQRPIPLGRHFRFRDNNKTPANFMPLSEYHRPHIRGIVVEDTKDFLFWLPLGGSNGSYETIVWRKLFDDQDMSCLVNPISAAKFYDKLIRGKRKSRKPSLSFVSSLFDGEQGKIVPYYLFDSSERHVTVYPGDIGEYFLDVPLLIKGNPKTKRPDILGIGGLREYSDPEDSVLSYHRIDGEIEKKAKKSLIERLGKI